MVGTIAGFDWDAGNRAKCRKHGVSTAETEHVLTHDFRVIPDPAHSAIEERFRAIGRTANGRSVFLVFTIRSRAGQLLIRPISARYMHSKEVQAYEEANPDLPD